MPRLRLRPAAVEQTPAGVPLDQLPHDTCVRCGRATPIGVSLCELDNPGAIGGPSTTQMHGTIFLGVVSGFVLLALGAKLAFSNVGPFTADLLERTPRPSGEVALVMKVTNDGTRDATATCHVSRGGLNSPDDLVFLTESIAPHTSRTYSRLLAPARADAAPFVLDQLTVACR